jgi:hypothetical protein
MTAWVSLPAACGTLMGCAILKTLAGWAPHPIKSGKAGFSNVVFPPTKSLIKIYSE